MGVENLFDNINLNGINDSLKLNLDGLNHYSKIGVNEWGSLSAAVSGSYAIESSDMRPAVDSLLTIHSCTSYMIDH